METPKRGCDLGTCVVNRAAVQKTDYFLRFRGLPRGEGLRSGPLRPQETRRFAFAFCWDPDPPTFWGRKTSKENRTDKKARVFEHL